MTPRSAVLAAILLATPALAQGEGSVGQEVVAPEAATAAPVQGTPRMVIASLELDVGEVEQGQDAVGTFVIRNEGDGELRILRAKPG